jgi:hypothetical protein
MRAERYQPADRAAWNEFVRCSKNGTFLFEREYMEYHSDRFTDLSMVFRKDDGRIAALLPACVQGDVLVSHAGLTYGGLVVHQESTLPVVLEAFGALIQRASAEGLRELSYKTLPAIYHNGPAEEDRYALFRAGARLARRDVWSVVDLQTRAPVQERRRRSLRRAEKAGVQIQASQEWGAFWDVLTENLQRRYGVRPVHSVEEITLLASRFPANIRLTVAHHEGRLVAGVVLYVTSRVVHVQYPGISEEGMALGALDALHFALIDEFARTHRYYDFGGVTEQGGRMLNRGLLEFKEGFGGRTITHDFYSLDLHEAAAVYDAV